MKEITKEELLIQKELWLEELNGFWHDAATAKEDLKIGKQVYSVLKEIIELKKELGVDYLLDQNRYEKGDKYYKSTNDINFVIDNNRQIKASIRLNTGKLINIKSDTSPNELTITELEDLNKKLSKLIKLIK
jgi:hypothetical protein